MTLNAETARVIAGITDRLMSARPDMLQLVEAVVVVLSGIDASIRKLVIEQVHHRDARISELSHRLSALESRLNRLGGDR